MSFGNNNWQFGANPFQTANEAAGQSNAPSNTTSSYSVFGQPTAPQTGIFSQSASSSGSNLGLPFSQGQGAPSKTTSIFGAQIVPQGDSSARHRTHASQASSMFGADTAHKQPVFGFSQHKSEPPSYSASSSIFRTTPTTTGAITESSFPQNSSNIIQGTSVFGIATDVASSQSSGGVWPKSSQQHPTGLFGQQSLNNDRGASLFGIKTPDHQSSIKGSIFMSNPSVNSSSDSTSSIFGKNIPSLPKSTQPTYGDSPETSPFAVVQRPSIQVSSREGGSRRKRSLDDGAVLSPADESESSEALSKRRTTHFSEADRGRFSRQIMQGGPKLMSKNIHNKQQWEKASHLGIQRTRKFSSSAADKAAAQTSQAIVCHDIPTNMGSKEAIRHHFSQFGNVMRVSYNCERNAATVTFSNPDEAKIAKAEGSTVSEDDPPMRIYFSKKARKSTDKLPGSGEPVRTTSRQKLTERMPAPHLLLTRGKSQKMAVSRTTRKQIVSSIYARTDDEKLQLLEKIDTLLRKQTVRQYDITKAKMSKGACPDMCPEKERYLRQQRKLLGVFEMDGNSIDHSRAIKEYSRSSADQEEPLPHELRPASVLRMTMNFILSEIISEIEDGQVADWYDFVWNRTRAIRKELTIQQIKDETAIEINEQCSRFHIFCAHHLCEEGVNVFAPKINNENLEKSMKTIMDLYQDVYFAKSSEQGSSFQSLEGSNVAEFYGYYILLNINRTAAVLNELQELPAVVRSSPEIGLAVEAFMSVHSNNYAKFFKVVRRASFLQGCILHRYFTQVRRKAVMTIAKAFGMPNKTVSFPVEDFAKVMCFNDDADLHNFCQFNSIHITNGMVEFPRSGIEEQEGAMVEMRSHVVASKVGNKQLGEIIANHELSPVDYVPYSSFDENGMYIGEHAALLSSENSPETFQALGQTPQPEEEDSKSVSEQPPMPPGLSGTTVKILAKELFHEVIDELCLALSKDTLDAIHCTLVYKDVVDDFIISGAQAVCAEVLEKEIEEKERRRIAELEFKRQLEERKRKREEEEKAKERERLENESREKEELERKRREMEAAKLEQGDIIASQLQRMVEDEIIESVVAETHIDEIEIRRQRRIDLFSDTELDDVTNAVVTSLLKEICRTTTVELKKKQCMEIYTEILTRKLERCFSKWRREQEAKVRFQTAKRTFPSVPCCRPIRDQIRILLPNQSDSRKRNSFPLDNLSEASLRSPMNLVEMRKRHKRYLNEKGDRLSDQYKIARDPLPFCDIVRQYHATGSELNDIRLKISILTPESIPTRYRELLSWLRYKFVQDESRVKIYRNANVEPAVNVCCRAIPDDVTRESVFGSFAVVFTLLPPDGPGYWARVRSRLENLISIKPAAPPVCLVMLTIGWDVEIETLETETGLPMLDFAISNYALYDLRIGVDSNSHNHQQLVESVRFLVENANPPPHLLTASMRDFFEAELASRYITPLYRHISQRQRVQMSPMEAHHQIAFFNAIVESLASATNGEELIEISWPPPEFLVDDKKSAPLRDWNSEDTLNRNLRDMLSCRMPDFPETGEVIIEEEIRDLLFGYVETVRPNCPILKSAVLSLVSKEFERLRNDLDLASDDDQYRSMFHWHAIIDCIISQHLTDLLYHSPLGESVITFPAEALQSLRLPPEFADLFSAIEYHAIDMFREPEPTVNAHSKRFESTQVSNIDERSPERSTIDTTWIDVYDEATNLEMGVDGLVERIHNEKRLNSEYEDRLRALLEEGDAPLSLLDSSVLSASLLAGHVTSVG